jgi:hypothetical protein
MYSSYDNLASRFVTTGDGPAESRVLKHLLFGLSLLVNQGSVLSFPYLTFPDHLFLVPNSNFSIQLPNRAARQQWTCEFP